MASNETFPPTARLHTPAEFSRVFEQRRSAASQGLVLYACPNAGGPPRLGMSVSRRIGGAVVRSVGAWVRPLSLPRWWAYRLALRRTGRHGLAA